MALIRQDTLLPVRGTVPPPYLSDQQVNALTEAFQQWFDEVQTRRRRIQRGRYWLTYLVLRFTGARIGEVLLLDDTTDINFRAGEIRMPTLKRKQSKGRRVFRQVFVPMNVISEIAVFTAEFPEVRGTVFKIHQPNFRRTFYEMCRRANIPKELGHPHILRHTRAIEMLRAGVPVTVVQDQLGHAYLSTTATYLRVSGQEARRILVERGLL